MKVSAQEEYGLRCMLQIARHQKLGKVTPLTLGEIAKDEGLTVPHVAKLIRRLRNSGLVQSVLGRAGGYVLTRPASEISVAEILAALGGKLYDTDYCGKHSGDLEVCSHMGDCSIRSLWSVLESLFERVLGKTMLSELVGSEQGMTAVLDGKAAAAGSGRACR